MKNKNSFQFCLNWSSSLFNFASITDSSSFSILSRESVTVILLKQLSSFQLHLTIAFAKNSHLCFILTRTHSVAVSFLYAGGLTLLLSLFAGSLFVGFDKVIVWRILHK
ncbi:hypothetical protein Ccrd_010302 [Cynara cardunculus var. scolymus]|uniref:Uncharacterized protein n=1 Tax=Cynara cardunculus var. scolymus TaxID=59895 RepID=A0A103YLI1_CYNCS|nr:hypothetical protein Ccrd_010302 [Cynara cardunculus var. scolymus]